MLVCLATYFIRKSCKDAMCPSWSAFSVPIIWLTILGLLFALIHKDCMYIFISSLTDDLLFLYEIFKLNGILILIYRFIFQKQDVLYMLYYTQQQKSNNPFSWFNSLGGLNWVCHKDNFRSYKFLFVNVMQYLVIQHLQYKIFTVYLYLYYKTCSVMYN